MEDGLEKEGNRLVYTYLLRVILSKQRELFVLRPHELLVLTDTVEESLSWSVLIGIGKTHPNVKESPLLQVMTLRPPVSTHNTVPQRTRGTRSGPTKVSTSGLLL